MMSATESPTRETRIVTLTVTGPSGTGKTTLCTALTGGDTGRTFTPENTVATEFRGTTVEGSTTTFKINTWSTPGATRFMRYIWHYVSQATVVLFLYDVTDPSTLRAHKDTYIPEFLQRQEGRSRPLMALVANKKDLLPAEGVGKRVKALQEEVVTMLEGQNLLLFEVSALTQENVPELLQALVRETLRIKGLESLPLSRYVAELTTRKAEDGTGRRCRCTVQ